MLLPMPETGAINCISTPSFVPGFTLSVASQPFGVSSSLRISTESLELPTSVPGASFPSRSTVVASPGQTQPVLPLKRTSGVG